MACYGDELVTPEPTIDVSNKWPLPCCRGLQLAAAGFPAPCCITNSRVSERAQGTSVMLTAVDSTNTPQHSFSHMTQLIRATAKRQAHYQMFHFQQESWAGREARGSSTIIGGSYICPVWEEFLLIISPLKLCWQEHIIKQIQNVGKRMNVQIYVYIMCAVLLVYCSLDSYMSY